jgi:hypothetical protein
MSRPLGLRLFLILAIAPAIAGCAIIAGLPDYMLDGGGGGDAGADAGGD